MKRRKKKLLKISLFTLSLGIIIFLLGEGGFDWNSQIKAQSEEISDSIDLSNLVADVDLKTRKSILYMPEWPKVIEEEKILYIPSTGREGVYICPKATSLEEIVPQCEDMITLKIGETKDELTLTTILYDDKEYYIVFGIKGSGGGEITPMAYKQDVINTLEKIKIDNRRLKMFISQAIRSIERSLDEEYWQDEDNLKYERKLGKRMFIREAGAARYLEFALNKEGFTEEQKEVIKQGLNDLVKADEILATDSLTKAKKYQGTNKKIDRYLQKAELSLTEAKECVKKEKYQRAILKFALAWQYSQKVIKLTEK